MTQEPLTSAGISAKQSALYALSNNNLQIEVDAIKANFRAWLKINFTFSSPQETYLDGMDDGFMDFAAAQTAHAVKNRLVINFDAPNPLPPVSISKMVTFTDTFQTLYSHISGYSASGELTFTLSY
ncbi:hypothetical protein [Pedobacter sp.]